MNLVFFLAIAIALIGLSIAVILRVLIKKDDAVDNALEQQREAENIRNLKKQLAELNDRLTSEAITQTEYDSYKLQAERRLLDNLAVSTTQSTDTPLATIIGICIGLPVVAVLFYIALGTPEALNKKKLVAVNSQTQTEQTVESVLAEINERLRIDPNDVEAQFALGQVYYANQQFTLARDTFKQVFEQQPDRPAALIAYAEALARTQNNFFKGVPLELINRTLQLNPKHKKANWLLGIAAFQENNTEKAIAIWQEQLARNDNSSQERAMLERMIGQAGGEQPKVKNKKDTEPPHLAVSASISDKLKGQYKPEDTVFIYVKAAAGPPLPLAIYRTTADKLPLSLTLTDADAMSPQMKLSMFDKVVAYARISKSGEAITQSGDLLGQSGVLTSSDQTISIEIDTVIP